MSPLSSTADEAVAAPFLWDLEHRLPHHPRRDFNSSCFPALLHQPLPLAGATIHVPVPLGGCPPALLILGLFVPGSIPTCAGWG